MRVGAFTRHTHSNNHCAEPAKGHDLERTEPRLGRVTRSRESRTPREAQPRSTLGPGPPPGGGAVWASVAPSRWWVGGVRGRRGARRAVPLREAGGSRYGRGSLAVLGGRDERAGGDRPRTGCAAAGKERRASIVRSSRDAPRWRRRREPSPSRPKSAGTARAVVRAMPLGLIPPRRVAPGSLRNPYARTIRYGRRRTAESAAVRSISRSHGSALATVGKARVGYVAPDNHRIAVSTPR